MSTIIIYGNNTEFNPNLDMEDLVKYGYILDRHRFRVPQKKDEYMTSFKDFDITFTFKNKMISKDKADKIVTFLKTIK
jgi:hypothetical protein